MPDALLSKTKGSVNAGGMVGADTGQRLAALSQKRDMPSLPVWEISCDLRLMSLFGHVLGTLSHLNLSSLTCLFLVC